jgi:hypothetical protein
VEVRRRMVVKVHVDGDAEELRDLGQAGARGGVEGSSGNLASTGGGAHGFHPPLGRAGGVKCRRGRRTPRGHRAAYVNDGRCTLTDWNSADAGQPVASRRPRARSTCPSTGAEASPVERCLPSVPLRDRTHAGYPRSSNSLL